MTPKCCCKQYLKPWNEHQEIFDRLEIVRSPFCQFGDPANSLNWRLKKCRIDSKCILNWNHHAHNENLDFRYHSNAKSTFLESWWSPNVAQIMRTSTTKTHHYHSMQNRAKKVTRHTENGWHKGRAALRTTAPQPKTDTDQAHLSCAEARWRIVDSRWNFWVLAAIFRSKIESGSSVRSRFARPNGITASSWRLWSIQDPFWQFAGPPFGAIRRPERNQNRSRINFRACWEW